MPSISNQDLNRGHSLPQKSTFFSRKPAQGVRCSPRTSIRPLVIMEELILGSLNLRCFFSSIPVDFLSFSLFCVENYLSFSLVPRLLLVMANRKWVPTTMARAYGAEHCQCWWKEPDVLSNAICEFIPKTYSLWFTKHWQAWPGD